MVEIYTDGGASGNPGPGGYGALLIYGKHRKEFSGAFRLTTNNRMELLAVIIALEALTRPVNVLVYSDSKYVVNAVSKGWLAKWQLTDFKKKKNKDLWKRYLEVAKTHNVKFQWVKGHAGNTFNEHVDQLAVNAYKEGPLLVDEAYESGASEG
ncbi:MAG: ribonuclease HI [Flavobacteriales bacterium]|nr:ribonuclease HI [Flavobacteriales bacterium]MDG1781463.1 ribonuclease HI [Flavobacteriales bacterium]MDG2246500.1 ribonuclease HI [Flavobacteriales bacterium]